MSGLYLQAGAARRGQGLQLLVYGDVKGYVARRLFTPTRRAGNRTTRNTELIGEIAPKVYTLKLL